MYSQEIIVVNIALNAENLLRVDLRCSHHIQKKIPMLITLIVISLCIYVSSHVVHLKNMQFS